ncbi:MAG: amidase, partial [Hyphomicrobiaceae bacterium]|nr:amidase [Hyphomicrobiaceae bacterium]
MTTDSAMLPLTEMAAQFRTGALTPLDVTKATLGRIEALEPKLEAFEMVLADRALAAAEAATRAIASGHRVGPFHGIPFALKDLVDVDGLVTTGGTNARANSVAKGTATIAKRLIAGGGVLIGKTKTVEVAYGAWGTNTRRGTPWNPWDAEVQRTPGGSSSGSGVAVAAGLAACAVGTDTGGSVRIPSAWCGLVGLKVTEGLLPLDGIVPLSHTLDTPGPMARTVEDAAIMFETMRGVNPATLDAAHAAGTGVFADLERGVAGLVFGVMTAKARKSLDTDVRAAFEDALARLQRMGATIVEFEPPISADAMRDGVGTIISSEGYFHHGALYEDATNLMDDDVRPRIMAGKTISARDYIGMRQQMARHRAEAVAAMGPLSALLSPTVATPPIPITDANQASTPAGLTRTVNYLGFCAASVPIGLTPAKLPTALQIAARGG